MSLLLSLPTELLESIVDITIPCGGFENFVTSCRTVYEASYAQISRYNDLRKKWQCTRPAFGKDNFTSSLDIIEAIVKDADIAWIIEDLDLNDALDLNERGYWNDDADSFTRWFPQFWAIRDGSIRERAKGLVLQSGVLASAGEDPDNWLIAVHAVDENGEPFADQIPWPNRRMDLLQYEKPYWGIFRSLFLLTLLPNLKRFKPPSIWGNILDKYAPKRLMKVLEHMVYQVRDNTYLKDLPLGKLQQLLPFEEICSQPAIRSSLGVVAPFTILPTLTDMHISNSITVNDKQTLAGHVTDETGIPFLWPYGDITSNLRTIQFEGSAINAAAIAQLLSHTPHVTTLDYTHDNKYRGCEYDWDAREFVAAVGEILGPTLTTLRIGFHDWGNPSVASNIQSLSVFSALESLQIHAIVLGAALPDLLSSSIKSITLESDTDYLTDWYGGGPISDLIFKRVDDLRDRARFPHLETFVLNLCVHRLQVDPLEDWRPPPKGVSMPISIEGPFGLPDPRSYRSMYRVHFDVKGNEKDDDSRQGFEDLGRLLRELHAPVNGADEGL